MIKNNIIIKKEAGEAPLTCRSTVGEDALEALLSDGTLLFFRCMQLNVLLPLLSLQTLSKLGKKCR